ncbi:1-aminocyclopropane-1-carboxylate deaminase/D-cysteine desulfhydrase [Algoriphagus terrigena]|uniref:1-aminocyclopropane-1-carboxylate deaminase/D-cysteine desulfhydrase n=1 Tax=Algoriphagus terrigena TaxID=344884 RepID=UPI00041342BA|nr:pyridoxal-phosphate dependent enzyme [Algoriphagus terrigena]
MLDAESTPLQYLSHSLLSEKEVELAVLRLDKVHQEVSGNKYFKLKYNLAEAKKLGEKTILTFGGAFSNHIYATASAAHTAGFHSIGIIRGEDADRGNSTLAHAQKKGMQLHFADRESYRMKNSAGFREKLRAQFGDFYLIPEGGTNEIAITGTKEILDEAHAIFSHVCLSIGTGGTFAGLAASLRSHQCLIGFSSLKGDFIFREIEELLTKYHIQSPGNLEIRTEYHFGGYGKTKPELINFMRWFYSEFGIPLDPIYTGKMAFGVWDLVEKDHFPKGSTILLIHTGGLQGNAGFFEQTGIDLPTL